MSRYATIKIYTVLNTVDDQVYVGSTTQPLCKRMWDHKVQIRNPEKNNRRLYKHMTNIGVDNVYIELIEPFPCSTREELLSKNLQTCTEQFLIDDI